jgi:hypothetical protein
MVRAVKQLAPGRTTGVRFHNSLTIQRRLTPLICRDPVFFPVQRFRECQIPALHFDSQDAKRAPLSQQVLAILGTVVFAAADQADVLFIC